MVDEARVLRLLRAITDDLSVLRHESEADDERRTDPIWLRGVKYTFVTAIEACVDVAQHICATQGWDRRAAARSRFGLVSGVRPVRPVIDRVDRPWQS